MGALSHFFSHLYTISIIFFSLFALELIILVRSVTGLKPTSETRVITTQQYLNLINKSNPTVSYSSKENKNKKKFLEASDECSVCLSEFEEGEKLRELKCKHRFHVECVDKWLHQKWATCPLCRRKVVPDDVVANNLGRLRNQYEVEEYDGSDEEMFYLLSSLQGNNFRRLF